MCLTPLTLKRDYNTLQGQTTKIVPCGSCVKCLQRRANAWSFRLYEELKVSSSATFLTLTYEDPPQSFNGHDTLDKTDLQRFFKRLRKQVNKFYPNTKIKYYAVGEYGTRTKRPHYHIILFNLPQVYLRDNDIISKIWTHGLLHYGECNAATIAYTTKYIVSGKFEPEADDDDRQPQFSTMSKKLGINHLSPAMVRFYKSRFISYATTSGGYTIPLPRYFRDKIFNKQQRKELAEEAARYRELDIQKWFQDEGTQKHVQWKKDQIRKQEKNKRLKRQKV